MKKFFILAFLSFLGTIVELEANMNSFFQEGSQTAGLLLQDAKNYPQNPGESVFPYRKDPKEASLKNAEMASQAQSEMRTNEVAQMVKESSSTRPHFTIDPSKDPLIADAKKIEENALEVIGGKGTQMVSSQKRGEGQTHVCEEAGEDAEFTCKATLSIKITETLGPLEKGTLILSGPAVYKENQSLFNDWPKPQKKHFVGHIRVGQSQLILYLSPKVKISPEEIKSVQVEPKGEWVHLWKKRYTFRQFLFTYTYQKKIKKIETEWIRDCDALETKADEGLCTYLKKECTKGQEDRIYSGVTVIQPCWEETFTYLCSYPSKNDCGSLRAQGCIQLSSTCKEKVGNTCVVYNQTYECPSGRQSLSLQTISGGNTPFCLDGNCQDQSWESNQEMASVLAQLSVLKEMQGQVSMGTIFKGTTESCKRQILGFRDCCRKGKGWGTDLNLAACSAEERALSDKRKSGLCHFIGTFCSEKVLGKCITKKSVYCCFGSKLLRAFHEQGRPQIKLGWGNPEHPVCRGFTVEKLQKIDFSKLNLQEVFEDRMKNYKPPQLKVIEKNVNDRMKAI